jgi:hypothetical protein
MQFNMGIVGRCLLWIERYESTVLVRPATISVRKTFEAAVNSKRQSKPSMHAPHLGYESMSRSRAAL